MFVRGEEAVEQFEEGAWGRGGRKADFGCDEVVNAGDMADVCTDAEG